MLKTADIDRFENFTCARASGGAKAAIALTVALHALIICGLAAISVYLAPTLVEPSEIETTFNPPPVRAVDLSLVENVAQEKPLRSEAATELQIRELPNDPPQLDIPEIVFEPTEPDPPEFSSDFLPQKEPPPKAETSEPPTKQKKSSPKKPTRPAAKPKPAVFSQASVRSTSRPSYPESARRKGIQGTTNVRLSLDSSGKVTTAAISKSSGNSALDASALKAARRWKFRPATSGGRPVASKIVVPISFRLN